MKPLASTSLPFPLLRRGKVRDVYDLGDRLLLVATDRVSAFDVVLSPGIPDKGKILNQLSNFWFAQFPAIENHLLETDASRFPEGAREGDLAGRAVVARKCDVLPFECVARGYLAGSGYKDYRRTARSAASLCLRGSPKPGAARTDLHPATKAETSHGKRSPFASSRSARTPGASRRSPSIGTSPVAARRRNPRRLEIEFGDRDGRLVWIDEAFTPDSSRFWPSASYRPGGSPPSLDKQFIRDWLERSGWNKTPPAPELPADVVRGTRERYLEAFRTITGREPEFVDA